MNRKQQLEFIKYLIVGGMNTAVTLFVIFVCKSVLGLNPYLSNAMGYVAGVTNSFLWNRSWVFHSNGKIGASASGDMLWQIGGFTLSGYGVATIGGMCVYTLCNFIYNRSVAFKRL